MTQIYIDEVYTTGGGAGCSVCKGPAVKAMCAVHLRKAREGFQRWTVRRRHRGLCVKCDCKGQRLAKLAGRRCIYCRSHRTENNDRCRAWMRKYGPGIYKSRRQAGVCVNNPTHGRVTGNHAYCDGCLHTMRMRKAA